MANTSEVSSVSDELTVQQEEAVQEQESTMQEREDVQQEKAVQEQEKAGQEQEAGQQEPEEQAANMSILAHLTELRRRILYSLLGVAIGSAIAYGFLDRIMAWLVEPAGKLYYMQPAEAFFVYIKVTMFSGFIISLPMGYVLGFPCGLGIVGIWIAFPFGLTTAGVLYWHRFEKEVKKMEANSIIK